LKLIIDFYTILMPREFGFNPAWRPRETEREREIEKEKSQET